MNEQEKKTLNERLAALDTRERHKLYKRASLLRKSRLTTTSRNRQAPVDDENEPVRIKIRKGDNLDDWVLKILDQEMPVRVDEDAEKKQGVVVWIGKKSCRVRVPGAEVLCEVSGDIQREQQTLLAVGDDVVVNVGELHNAVRQVLPRRTRLSRPDQQNPNIERVVVANVDIVVITVSVKTPPLHPRLIDRYLVAIQRGGAKPIICVNKLDLLSDVEREVELAKLQPYITTGVEITTCSTVSHEGMLKLKQAVEGKTCAFVGHSGVGKSSILNAIKPDLNLDTGGVSESYGRGTHTTTASSLYYLPGNTRLIDTPGIRSFGLWKMSAQELCWYFPEFESPAGSCKFGDCSHTHEPICGVKAAVNDGRVSRHRYETYMRLLGR